MATPSTPIGPTSPTATTARGIRRRKTIGDVTFELTTAVYHRRHAAEREGVGGIYDSGCKNGLVLKGKARCAVSVLGLIRGATWQECGDFPRRPRPDRSRQRAGANICCASTPRPRTPGVYTDPDNPSRSAQANAATMPAPQRTAAARSRCRRRNKRCLRGGPNLAQARLTLSRRQAWQPRRHAGIRQTRGQEPAVTVLRRAHVPVEQPAALRRQVCIELSDRQAGKTWQPMVKDWS